MNSLVLISDVGPLEGNILTQHLEAKSHAIFYHVSENKFYPEGIVQSPVWLDAAMGLDNHILISRYFESLISRHDISRVMAIGFDASIFAHVSLGSLSVMPVVLRGELDFSRKRRHLSRKFEIITENFKALFLEDQWEMNKASSHGSMIPHFRFPIFGKKESRILSRKDSHRRVALIHPPLPLSPKVEQQLSEYSRILEDSGFAIQHVSIDDLYSTVDLKTNRTFPATMRYRIGDCTHAVIIGDSRNTNSVIAGLSLDANRVYIEDTFNTSFALNKKVFRNYGRGMALIQKLISNEESELVPGLSSDVIIRKRESIFRMDTLWNSHFPSFYEDIDVDDYSEKLFDVFYSVAPIENRTNGARPQRIRNMAEDFASDFPCLLITADSNIMNRKSLFIQWLIGQGYRATSFYGENSTSPLPNYDSINQLSVILADIRSCNAFIGWFVRDLHWLDQTNSYLEIDSPEYAALKSRGIFELSTVAHFADCLFAPNSRSISGFQSLLLDTHIPPVEWKSLTPGVSPSNAWPPPSSLSPVSDGRVTVVYSGGIGDIYRMDNFLDAIQIVNKNDFYFDFIVRKDEQSQLEDSLLEHGIIVGNRVRLLNVDFEDYVPRTSKAIGVVLLDGDYAKFSFPYKTMSFIEKRFPVLTYDDMAISGFVTDEGVGISCGRLTENIVDALMKLAVMEDIEFEFDASQESNSWKSRLAPIRVRGSV